MSHRLVGAALADKNFASANDQSRCDEP